VIDPETRKIIDTITLSAAVWKTWLRRIRHASFSSSESNNTLV